MIRITAVVSVLCGPLKYSWQIGDHMLALWRVEEEDWREVTIIEKKKDK
jgi:hypothetical protein